MPQGGSRIHTPGKDKIIAGERISIVPGEPRPKMVARLHSTVGEHFPAVRIELHQRFGQVWIREAALIKPIQRGVEERDWPSDRAVDDHQWLESKRGRLAPES